MSAGGDPAGAFDDVPSRRTPDEAAQAVREPDVAGVEPPGEAAEEGEDVGRRDEEDARDLQQPAGDEEHGCGDAHEPMIAGLGSCRGGTSVR